MYTQRYKEVWMYETAQQFAALAQDQGVHPASLAVAWVAYHPAVTAPIIGARSVEQLEALLKSLDVEMTPDLYTRISQLSPTPPPATDRSEEVDAR
jgi:aryl-alcohol dehydrogenase-like predicted oxidoreductase